MIDEFIFKKLTRDAPAVLACGGTKQKGIFY